MLDSLAVELTAHICSFLDDASLEAVRQVSRHLNAVTFPQFAKTRYDTVKTRFLLADIPRLRFIADHDELRFAVKTLVIPRIVEDEDAKALAAAPWPRLESGGIDLLAPAAAESRALFSRFPNMRRLELRSSPFWHHVLNPMDVLRLLTTPPSPPLSGDAETPRSILSFTIDDWNAVEPEELRPHLVDPVVAALTPELEELDWHWHSGTETAGDVLTSFLAGSTRLRRLRLKLCGSTQKWETLAHTADTAPATASPLQTLEIEKIRWTLSSLNSFCFQFGATLTSLSLTRVFLVEGHWADFFRTATTSLPKLRCITLHRVYEASPAGSRWVEVRFHPISGFGEPAEYHRGSFEFILVSTNDGAVGRGMRYEGTEEWMSGLLEYLAAEGSSRGGIRPAGLVPLDAGKFINREFRIQWNIVEEF